MDLAANVSALRRAERAVSICSACRGIDSCGLGTGGMYPRVVRFDGRIVVEEASCRYLLGKRAMERSLAISSLGERFRDRTFDRFEARPGNRVALQRAREVAEREDVPGLFLTGRPGVGKTHLAAAIFWRKSERGIVVRMQKAANVYARLRAAITEGGGAETAIVDELVLAPVVILDDADKIGAGVRDGVMSGYAQELFYRIVDGRYERSAQTIITANADLMGLRRKLGDFGEAIVSRIFEMCDPIVVEGEDRRLVKR